MPFVFHEVELRSGPDTALDDALVFVVVRVLDVGRDTPSVRNLHISLPCPLAFCLVLLPVHSRARCRTLLR